MWSWSPQPAQQALRARHKDEDHDAEGDRVGEHRSRAWNRLRERLDEAEDEAANHGGADAAEAAEDDDDESLEGIGLTGGRRDRLDHRNQSARHPRAGRTEAVRDRVRVPKVDADQLR